MKLGRLSRQKPFHDAPSLGGLYGLQHSRRRSKPLALHPSSLTTLVKRNLVVLMRLDGGNQFQGPGGTCPDLVEPRGILGCKADLDGLLPYGGEHSEEVDRAVAIASVLVPPQPAAPLSTTRLERGQGSFRGIPLMLEKVQAVLSASVAYGPVAAALQEQAGWQDRSRHNRFPASSGRLYQNEIWQRRKDA
jgi:hypothetical protein